MRRDEEEEAILARYGEVLGKKGAWLRDQAAGLRRAADALDSAAQELELRASLHADPFAVGGVKP